MSTENTNTNIEPTTADQAMADRFAAGCKTLGLNEASVKKAKEQFVADYARLGTTPNQAILTDVKQAVKDALAERTIWEKTKESLVPASITLAGLVVGGLILGAIASKKEETPEQANTEENPFASTDPVRASARPVKSAI